MPNNKNLLKTLIVGLALSTLAIATVTLASRRSYKLLDSIELPGAHVEGNILEARNGFGRRIRVYVDKDRDRELDYSLEPSVGFWQNRSTVIPEGIQIEYEKKLNLQLSPQL